MGLAHSDRDRHGSASGSALRRAADAIAATCAVTTEAWGRCPLGNVSIVRVNGTGSEDLILPLCQTHAAMFGAKA